RLERIEIVVRAPLGPQALELVGAVTTAPVEIAGGRVAEVQLRGREVHDRLAVRRQREVLAVVAEVEVAVVVADDAYQLERHVVSPVGGAGLAVKGAAWRRRGGWTSGATPRSGRCRSRRP